MIYFRSREAARSFARRNPDKYKVKDLKGQGLKYRWGVQVLDSQQKAA